MALPRDKTELLTSGRRRHLCIIPIFFPPSPFLTVTGFNRAALCSVTSDVFSKAKLLVTDAQLYKGGGWGEGNKKKKNSFTVAHLLKSLRLNMETLMQREGWVGGCWLVVILLLPLLSDSGVRPRGQNVQLCLSFCHSVLSHPSSAVPSPVSHFVSPKSNQSLHAQRRLRSLS